MTYTEYDPNSDPDFDAYPEYDRWLEATGRPLNWPWWLHTDFDLASFNTDDCGCRHEPLGGYVWCGLEDGCVVAATFNEQ